MSVVKELLRGEQNGSISFGDYTLDKKAKLDNFEHGGDIYKVKTFYEITKLEKNGLFVYESVPGSAVTGFTEKENGVSFQVESNKDIQITLELAESTEYAIYVDNEQVGLMETNMSGKLSFSVELPMPPVNVKVVER
ncbi:endosialidase [Hominifimenecus microfluidus]|uniref:Endosialidase n=1 Tax=Hominifimenecus microfluidus TaxID=2885348 RepID=A0AAE3JEW4_9FIRM|nr:endosialidase [Hominifimenecus microfluidus]MCC2230182.1 endosialidase [Hominifimenecus microfluidus]